VAQAHREGIGVVPLVGPSSVALALMASGMNGQGFSFHGYPPVKADARTAAIHQLEATPGVPICADLIETPYRNGTLLAAPAAACKPATRLCVAADPTLATESVVPQTISAWRRRRHALRASGDLHAAGLKAVETTFHARMPLRRLSAKGRPDPTSRRVLG
jgi:16S rRNA (cytidine1402-2'-O)-methyltransferase